MPDILLMRVLIVLPRKIFASQAEYKEHSIQQMLSLFYLRYVFVVERMIGTALGRPMFLQ
jgi:hypothetical protein